MPPGGENGGQNMNRVFGYDSPLGEILTKIVDCICVSMLWLVCSLPVITMGASSTALYAAVHRCIRNGTSGLWRSFWDAFRENWKRSTLVWLVELLVLLILTVDLLIFWGLELSGGIFKYLYWAALALWCVALTWTVYLAAYTARFHGSVREVLRFGFLLMFMHPIKVLGVLIPAVAGLALSLMVPVSTMIAPAAVYWISSFTLEKLFRMHMQPKDLEKESGSH